MASDRFYRLLMPFVAIGVFAAVLLFLHLARLAGQSQREWSDLPAPVREAVRQRVDVPVAVVQVQEGATPRHETYLVTVEWPSGDRERLWLAADGSAWPSPRDPSSD